MKVNVCIVNQRSEFGPILIISLNLKIENIQFTYIHNLFKILPTTIVHNKGKGLIFHIKNKITVLNYLLSNLRRLKEMLLC